MARGFTQAELQRRVGLRAQSAISDYERGTTSIDVDTLIRVAHALGTSVAALVGEAPDPAVDLASTPTARLLAGLDISDLTPEEQHEVQGLVAYLVDVRRRRRRRATRPTPLQPQG